MIVQQLAGVVGMLQPKALILSPSSANVTGFDIVGPVYAGIQFLASGEEWSTGFLGSPSFDRARGLWIDRGDPSRVWVQWVRSGGTLGDWNSADAGDTILQMDVDRAWRIERPALGQSTIIGTFNFYNAGVGGDLLATTDELTFTARVESDD